MLSSKSINNRLFTSTGLLLWGGFGVLTMAGCASKNTPASIASATPAPVIRAYVRSADLVAAHPLQADVKRLRQAEADLRRLAFGAEANPADSAAALALPALGKEINGAGVFAAAARQIRRTAARAALDGAFDQQIKAFVEERGRRQQRLEDQRRDELTTLDANKEAERERLAREAIDGETRNSLRNRAADKTKPLVGFTVADAQLDPKAGVFPPLLDREALDAEIVRLQAGVDTKGIGPRARLELQRRLLLAQLEKIRLDLASIAARGNARADAAAKQVAEQREQEIEAELEGLREDAETRFLVRAQEGARDRALATEAALGEQAGRERRLLLNGEGSASGQLRLTTVFPVVSARRDPTGAQRAAERIAAERVRLEQFFRADVADTVRDVAQERNIDVVQVTGPPLSAKEGRTAGRRDMTRQFIGWTKPGAILAATAPKQ